MKEFFDTSVLVPAFVGDHPHHVASVKVFVKATKKHSFCAAHSLAELYSTLTSLPLKPMISPDQAVLFIQEARNRLSIIALDEIEYYAAIEQMAEKRITGGRIYDGLLLHCAMKAKAETIYTWNLKHFQHLFPELSEKVKTP
jgi:predicted nucleic acid-binding protein